MANDENEDVKDEPGAESDTADEKPDHAGDDTASASSSDEEAAAAPPADDADDGADVEEPAAPAVKATPVHDADHAHQHAEADHGHGDELAHTTPIPLLFAVWGSLMFFTILTVSVTHIDFGGQTNLVVAMIIATIKAGLVVTFFMHLRWDRRFHALVFLSSLLFVMLFIGLALTDRSEYQPNIDTYEAAKAQQ